jgi:RNA polymerase sigma-32 factor
MSEDSGSRRSLMKAAMNAPFLDREEEMELAVRWKDRDDEVALHRLAQAHMRLVIAIAARFRHYGLPMSDLIQEGHVGLLEAASRFEPEREVRFSTYATWWIRASIQDYILRNWSIVRGGTSSAQKALFFNLRRLRAQLSQTLGSGVGATAIHQHIARTVGVAVADVAVMDARISGADVSLNAPAFEGQDGGADERMSQLVDAAPRPDDVVQEAIDSDRRARWLNEAMQVLSPRERNILTARRMRDEAATLECLGAELGISKERVRQIESRALEKLRKELVERQAIDVAALI